MYEHPEQPLAAPSGQSMASAEPAKVIGWLLLAGFGVLNLFFYTDARANLNLVLGLGSLGIVAGFVMAHRRPGTTFARLWIGVFTALIGIGAGIAKLYPVFF